MSIFYVVHCTEERARTRGEGVAFTGHLSLAKVPSMNAPARPDLAPLIDHTLLSPTAKAADVRQLCAEVKEHGFATACVASRWVSVAFEVLGAGKVCTVVGFPHGDGSSAGKAAETRQAVADGAAEIDMVIALGPLLDGDLDAVREDIAAVVEAAQGRPVKVILETARLDAATIRAACEASVAAGAAFVKTATGFGPGGASVEALKIMREVVGPELGVKASGGVRSADDADRFIAAGASRLGASRSLQIIGVQSADGGGDGGYG